MAERDRYDCVGNGPDFEHVSLSAGGEDRIFNLTQVHSSSRSLSAVAFRGL